MTAVNTVVIGAGHTGLAMSLCLRKRGVEHLVLERGEIGQRWRDERWDSLTLLTPNWMTQLPGYHYDGSDPDGFETRDGYIAYLERYAANVKAPIQTHTTVEGVDQPYGADGYRLRTSQGPIEANNVVVATGPFHRPHTPDPGETVPQAIVQLHSSQYRNPDQLPDGPVLVVGGGNSGLQIVEDLLRAGRTAYLSASNLRCAPRRYRGKDIIWWLIEQGALDRRVEDLPSPAAKNAPPPLLTGVAGGHDFNLREFADRGVTFLGRLRGGSDGRLVFSEDINTTLAKAAEAYGGFQTAVDQYITAQGLMVPAADAHQPVPDILPPPIAEPITELDLERAGIRSIVWATGFRYSYDWVHLPVFDDAGEPLHKGGVTTCPGFYFLGLRWLRKYKSFFIYGVGEDAELLAGHIAQRATIAWTA